MILINQKKLPVGLCFKVTSRVRMTNLIEKNHHFLKNFSQQIFKTCFKCKKLQVLEKNIF